MTAGPDDPSHQSSRMAFPDLQTLRGEITHHAAVLWRRKILIMALVALVMAAAVIVVGRIPPKYTAESLVIIEGQTTRILNMQDVASGLRVSRFSLLGQVEVLQSRELIGRVVDKLDLTKSVHFNSSLRPPKPFYETLSPMAWAKGVIKLVVPRDWIDLIRGERPAAAPVEIGPDHWRRQAVNRVRGSLRVKPRGLSNVVGISFQSGDPAIAAAVANAIAESYILDQLDAKFRKTQQATEWLNERLTGLRAKVRAGERLVAAFREKHGLIGVGGKGLTDEKLSDLNNQLVLAQSERAEAQARYRQVRRLLQQGGNIESSATVIRSPLIQRLREQEALMLRKVAELANRYGERHPKMINARSELKDLSAKINSEIRKIAQLLENELEVAKSREATIKEGLTKLESKAGAEGRASVRLRELEREAEASRTLYEAFLSRFKETSNQKDIQQADARVISRADIPNTPSSPRRGLILMGTFVIALLGAGGFALLLEYFDRGMRGAEMVEQITRLPVISMVPALGRNTRREKIAPYVLDNPLSAVSEAIRNLHTGVLLSNPDSPPRTICLTSSLPGEGKTIISIWLARNAAAQGRKVLLMDCDLRRPRLHTVLGLSNDRNIMHLAAGTATLEECIQKDEVSGADVLLAAPMHGNAQEFVGSHRMAELLAELRDRYEMVVIDSPPVLAVSDARLICHAVDSTIFLIRWDKTERAIVESAVRLLNSENVNIAGVALSQVDTRKHKRYGYRDYGYYYGRYKDYYTNS